MFVIRGRLVSVGTVQASDHEISIRVKKKSDATSAVLTHVFAVRYHYAMLLHMKRVKNGKRSVNGIPSHSYGVSLAISSSSSSSSSFYCNKGMTERKPTNDNLIIQINNSYDITYGLKNYSQKDVWSEQVAGKSVYAV